MSCATSLALVSSTEKPGELTLRGPDEDWKQCTQRRRHGTWNRELLLLLPTSVQRPLQLIWRENWKRKEQLKGRNYSEISIRKGPAWLEKHFPKRMQQPRGKVSHEPGSPGTAGSPWRKATLMETVVTTLDSGQLRSVFPRRHRADETKMYQPVRNQTERLHWSTAPTTAQVTLEPAPGDPSGRRLTPLATRY